MLRARKGITSSAETFWLIPAIRKKERRGPGMVTVDASCSCTPRSSDVDVNEREAAVPQTSGAKLAHQHAKITNGAERQKGYFIVDTRPQPLLILQKLHLNTPHFYCPPEHPIEYDSKSQTRFSPRHPRSGLHAAVWPRGLHNGLRGLVSSPSPETALPPL